MDAISRLGEALLILYTFVPKEIVILVMAGIIMIIWNSLKDKEQESAKDN